MYCVQIANLLDWLTDAQKWFSTGKVGPLLQSFCKQQYGTTRAFIFPAETRFAGKLLQIKRFLSLRDAIQRLVQSSEYRRFEFQNDIFAERLVDREVWSVMERIVNKTGPILLLLRLAGGWQWCDTLQVKGDLGIHQINNG